MTKNIIGVPRSQFLQDRRPTRDFQRVGSNLQMALMSSVHANSELQQIQSMTQILMIDLVLGWLRGNSHGVDVQAWFDGTRYGCSGGVEAQAWLAGTGYGPEMSKVPLRICSGRLWSMDWTSVGSWADAGPQTAPIDEPWATAPDVPRFAYPIGGI